MGIGDRMKGFANNMQDGAKNTSISLFHILLRLVTGVLLGLTLALIGQELVGYGSFALMFVMITVVAIVYKLLGSWGIGQILIFDLICVLVAMLLRMYILVAP
jgi:hypothetical protein